MTFSDEISDRPVVLIVGGGLGGLMMALLLDQINISYHVFERASEIKPFGAIMAFGGNTLPVFEQLGLYEDLKNVSKGYTNSYFCDGNGKMIGDLNLQGFEDATGHKTRVFARPDFYNVLRKRIPENKISLKKKIVKIVEKDEKITIHCSDDTFYEGDILIGADGVYSGVRQSMYKQMDEQGILPKTDLEGFSVGYSVVVGVTKSLDPEKYPAVKEEHSKFTQILYDSIYNCYVITLTDNRICWGLGTQLPQSVKKETSFRNSKWSSEENESILKNFRGLPNPVGGTMGEMFDATPKDLISSVYLEEKLFKTWYHGRTVLIGDACHKMHPAGGQGGTNAIFDAVALANCLYAMKDNSAKSIKKAFEDYYDERFESAEKAFNSSSVMAKIMNGQKLMERLFRKIMLNYIPTWVLNIALAKVTAYRPQVAWLPLFKSSGSGKVLPQIWEKKSNRGVVKELLYHR